MIINENCFFVTILNRQFNIFRISIVRLLFIALPNDIISPKGWVVIYENGFSEKIFTDYEKRKV